MVRVTDDLRRLEECNRQLTEDNLALKKQIEQLQRDQRYLEELARDHGFAKENELIYELKKKHK